MLTIDEMNERLRSALSLKRYQHTLGVVSESVKLAERYGENVDKARIAGLLHDCAKDYPDKLKLRLCKEYHIPLDDEMKAFPDLTHPFLGAEIAKREYGVGDEDILNAIRYHTTGHVNMSLLEKIIYMADYIEPNRKPFDGLDKARELAYTNLDNAIAFGLRATIRHLETKKRSIYYLTYEALDSIIKKEGIR